MLLPEQVIYTLISWLLFTGRSQGSIYQPTRDSLGSYLMCLLSGVFELCEVKGHRSETYLLY